MGIHHVKCAVNKTRIVFITRCLYWTVISACSIQNIVLSELEYLFSYITMLPRSYVETPLCMFVLNNIYIFICCIIYYVYCIHYIIHVPCVTVCRHITYIHNIYVALAIPTLWTKFCTKIDKCCSFNKNNQKEKLR